MKTAVVFVPPIETSFWTLKATACVLKAKVMKFETEFVSPFHLVARQTLTVHWTDSATLQMALALIHVRLKCADKMRTVLH